jgi:pimeloyl-ACP methyl ester carboxylesterase
VKYIKITAFYVLLPLLLIFIGASGASVYLIDFGKKAYRNDTWYNVENGGIDESKYVSLGGLEQFVRIRGRDLNNPVLLYLHGGPGFAMTNFTHRLFRPQTEYFTLVEWDQRGAGKSSGDESINATMSYEQMVDDTIELIEYLQTRLKVEKVIVVGSSWGTMLGLGVIRKRPDLVHAYVGSGQGLAWRATLDESQRLMIEAAGKLGDKETLATLKAIPEEWPPEEDWRAYRSRVLAVQKHLPTFRASYYPFKDPFKPQGLFVIDTLFSPDSPLSSFLNIFRSGEERYGAVQALRQSLWDFNLLDKPEYYEFEVPIIIFQGEHDWQTPNTLVKEWFSKVKAPHKEYIAFEHSAHYVITEEPAKYIHSLISRVRPFAVGTDEP